MVLSLIARGSIDQDRFPLDFVGFAALVLIPLSISSDLCARYRILVPRSLQGWVSV